MSRISTHPRKNFLFASLRENFIDVFAALTSYLFGYWYDSHTIYIYYIYYHDSALQGGWGGES